MLKEYMASLLQPPITVGNPYPQQNIPVGTPSQPYNPPVPEDIEDDFNWDRLL